MEFRTWKRWDGCGSDEDMESPRTMVPNGTSLFTTCVLIGATDLARSEVQKR